MSHKLTRAPLYEQAYEAILGMILAGVLVPGQRVTEKSLAEDLGVSPTPVREAMRKLEHDGLLESDGNAVQIVNLLPADIRHLYACRGALEVVAIEAAVMRLSSEDLALLEKLLTSAEASARDGDFLQMVQTNTMFHDKLIEATGNRWLAASIGLVRRPLLLARIQLSHDQAEVERILGQHREILAALRARDVEAASAAVRRHMQADCDHMCEVMGRPSFAGQGAGSVEQAS